MPASASAASRFEVAKADLLSNVEGAMAEAQDRSLVGRERQLGRRNRLVERKTLLILDQADQGAQPLRMAGIARDIGNLP